MLSYMDYVQRCFYNATGWNEDMSYEQILRTSANLLSFPVPSGSKLSISSKNTEYSYSSLTLAQLSRLTGSLSYMYSSVDLNDSYLASGHVPLYSVLDDYRFVRSPHQQRQYDAQNRAKQQPLINKAPWILYGKIYFPSQFLEGMAIKRITKNVQVLMKFIDTPRLKKMSNTSTILTIYVQQQNDRTATDFIYSTNDALMGMRCLFKIGSDLGVPTPPQPATFSSPLETQFSQSTSLSLGGEVWFALKAMSPGLSGSIRYSTNLSSGKPLTATFALNPLLGTIESSYAVKPNLSSTLCSKYIFNMYSYESDLLVGASFLRCSNNPLEKLQRLITTTPKPPVVTAVAGEAEQESPPNMSEIPDPQKLPDPQKFNSLDQQQQQKIVDSFMGMDPSKMVTENNTHNFMSAFNKADWQSSFKAAASVAKMDVNISWEGRWKDILLSSGVHIDCNDVSPKIGKYGFEFQFTS